MESVGNLKFSGLNFLQILQVWDVVKLCHIVIQVRRKGREVNQVCRVPSKCLPTPRRQAVETQLQHAEATCIFIW